VVAYVADGTEAAIDERQRHGLARDINPAAAGRFQRLGVTKVNPFFGQGGSLNTP
jgi:hypothetical protein